MPDQEPTALFPKWVEPHASHIVADAYGNLVAPLFSEQHIDRVSSKLSVLVKDEGEEAVALAAKVEPAKEEAEEPKTDLADAD